MSHHSDQPFDFNKMDIEKMFESNEADFLKSLNQQQPISLAESLKPKHDEVTGKFEPGEELPAEQPENKFPDGKINESDQGQFQYGMRVDEVDGRLIMNFFKPVQWIGFTKREAELLVEYIQSKLSQLK